jgi:hypothetical protein
MPLILPADMVGSHSSRAVCAALLAGRRIGSPLRRVMPGYAQSTSLARAHSVSPSELLVSATASGVSDFTTVTATTSATITRPALIAHVK